VVAPAITSTPGQGVLASLPLVTFRTDSPLDSEGVQRLIIMDLSLPEGVVL